MFERYLTDALVTRFGHVVENLDSDKVRLSAWNGQLALEELSLRSNALETFTPDCPVEIAYGKIGKLELNIPWKLFSSTLRWRRVSDQPQLSQSGCTIVLTDVNILIIPRRRDRTIEEEANVGYTSPDSQDEQRSQKEKEVQSLLDANLLERVTASSVSSSRWSWVRNWLSSLLSSLSVTVKNIHIRYEDPGTSMGFSWSINDFQNAQRYRPAFAAGITLLQFSVHSDDSHEQGITREEGAEFNGKADDSERETKEHNKTDVESYDIRNTVAAAERLAIYWDSDCHLISINAGRIGGGESRPAYSYYCQSSFAALNNETNPETNTIFLDQPLYKRRHSYLMDPMSPSINLTLISERQSSPYTTIDEASSSDSEESSTDSASAPAQTAITPPSSIGIDLPPCKFTLSRSTLEDTAYIRRSLAVWSQATKGVLSEASLRRLARLRPVKSPTEDPRSWWFYASEATQALLRVNREGQDLDDLRFRRRRRRGWLGLAQALGRRRRYLHHYKRLLGLSSEESAEQRPAIHTALLEMEDDLLPEEIMAFRISLYDSITTKEIEMIKSSRTKGSGWAGWMPKIKSSNDEIEKDGIEVAIDEQKFLSIEHRQRMAGEMIRALERERANVQSRARDGNRQASTRELVHNSSEAPDFNPILWKSTLVCRELALQVNDEADKGQKSSGRSRISPVIRISTALVHDQSWYEDNSWDADCTLASLAVKDLTWTRYKSSKQSQIYFPNLIGRKRGCIGQGSDNSILIDGIRYHQSVSINIRRQLHWRKTDGEVLRSDVDRGSTTKTQIRIEPLELVYSTLPAEALGRVLATIKTPELVDDYHRMASAAHKWRESKRRKILQALAHKHKKIIIDIDVGSPELLIPEEFSRKESPMLAIDLGRLQIFNATSLKSASESDFDDQWRLVLSDIQVRSTTVASNHARSEANEKDTPLSIPSNQKISPRQLVEPFSLDFTISTKFVSSDSEHPQDRTRAHISATLPRLAFNLTSSALRLVLRLQEQWRSRRDEMKARATYHLGGIRKVTRYPLPRIASPRRMSQEADNKSPPPSRTQDNRIIRSTEFQFWAPVIALRLENDVDGRDCQESRGIGREEGEFSSTTPLVDLSFRGIRGKVVQDVFRNGDSKKVFDARLHSLGVIDLYQNAGKDFTLLMSSAPQELLLGNVPDDGTVTWESIFRGHEDSEESHTRGRRKDLVKIEYSSSNTTSDEDGTADLLSIWFHELYVEWNPETLAAIQKAVRMPITESGPAHYATEREVKEDDSDEEFFDAIEDEFFDAGYETDSILLSEISSSMEHESIDGDLFSAASSTAALTGMNQSFHGNTSSLIGPLTPPRPTHSALATLSPIPLHRNSSTLAGLSPPRLTHTSTTPLSPFPLTATHMQSVRRPAKKRKPFELVFELSKLRVSFNKETRHRKIVVAEMDGTAVCYATRRNGGSITSMSIGNLVFIDPASRHNTTLYSQILGLKSNEAYNIQQEFHTSSLLEMEIEINPKKRQFVSEAEMDHQDARNKGIYIDRQRGKVTGCNYFVRAKFSPMRFVFLEQLWFEIMDYFFEGIIGTEVWGGKKPTFARDAPLEKRVHQHSGSLGKSNLHGSDAAGFNFTRFDISLESPELLFPVAYQSPHFVRLELANIHASNHYDGSVVRDADLESNREFDRMQWFNNCDISLQDLRLFSWCGRELGKEPVIADIVLRWPSGPLAYRIVPKWKVACRFDSLDLSLRRCDYALLQHIISHNIGEPSRNLNEWEALQSLPTSVVEELNKKIMVKFGYDKKDVAPTTYDFTVSIPSVSFSLVESTEEAGNPLAIARCLDLVWQLRKESDLVVKQKATCDVDLGTPDPTSGFEKMLSLSKYDNDISSEKDDLTDLEAGVPELTYTSTTRPSGDNTKTLEILEACIYMVVPAWKRFVEFFQDLPLPLILSEVDIGASIQVGDRWYRIDGGASRGHEVPVRVGYGRRGEGRSHTWIESYTTADSTTKSEREYGTSILRHSPTFQLRVSLKWPRIILTSSPIDGPVARLVLRMHHLEYLHTNIGKEQRISRSFFLHDVEVYTSSSKKLKRHGSRGENSLIHPWCVAGQIDKCNGESLGDCEKHTVKISGDVLQARAAYSDMAIAIEVCLSVFHSTKGSKSSSTRKITGKEISRPLSHSGYAPEQQTSPQVAVACKRPNKNIYSVVCDGFELRVADDSGRHFAGTQDLIILSLGKLLFSREDSQNDTSSVNLRLYSLELFDCLQADNSPFRIAASSRAGAMGLKSSHNYASSFEGSVTLGTEHSTPKKMTWDGYCTRKVGEWSFATAPELLHRTHQAFVECASAGKERQVNFESFELIEIGCVLSLNKFQDYKVRLRSFALQWNPSTIIAIQRFLGRLWKDSRTKAIQVFHEQSDDLIPQSSNETIEDATEAQFESSTNEHSVTIRATVEVDSLTLCLNKEHQRRRLLELTFSSCQIQLDSSELGLSVDGHLGDLNAWDSDNYSGIDYELRSIIPENRSVLKVISTATSQANKATTPDSRASRSPFLEVHYKTFKRKFKEALPQQKVPNWVDSHVAESGDIDDFLSLTIAALQFTYLRERTEEILDYLSNGLPGKGMGATSRAAKGFLTKRILTKSFLELQIDSPQFVVPQHGAVSDSLALQLGDVNLRSWFEEAAPNEQQKRDRTKDVSEVEWWRVLSLGITGFKAGVKRYGHEFAGLSSATNPIDLEIELRKPTVQGRELSMKGKLSFVDLKLNYSDYVLLRAVARDNIGRKGDKERWDNVEKAYWLEEAVLEGFTDVGTDLHETPSSLSQTPDKRVAYSSNARFVRYGKGSKKKNIQTKPMETQGLSSAEPKQSSGDTSNTLDLQFELDGLSLTLRRDDQVEGVRESEELALAFQYDVILLRVQVVEISIISNDNGDMSFHLSLFRLGLFDLGDHGRLIRERFYANLPQSSGQRSTRKGLRQPCPFYVLAEGYSPTEADGGNDRPKSDHRDGPQFVVTVDRCAASSVGAVGSLADSDLPPDSNVTVARIVINYLSMNALVRPFKEVAEFFSCDWPTHSVVGQISRNKMTEKIEGVPNDEKVAKGKGPYDTSRSRGFQLKLVAHYPRIFFLANESDIHSRALVLRGLAVVNASNITSVQSGDTRRTTAVDAQLHRMESYINPDVESALRFNHRHSEMVGDGYSSILPKAQEETGIWEEGRGDSHGVALIQPVTLGLEYGETKRDLFPTKRLLFVNIEPVSTMLSFEDLQLVEAVMKRWSSARSTESSDKEEDNQSSTIPGPQPFNTRNYSRMEDDQVYDVVFYSDRLGLGLRMDGSKIVVNGIQNADHSKVISTGDCLIGIGGDNFEGRSLAEVVKHLSESDRPISIKFRRPAPQVAPDAEVATTSAEETVVAAAFHEVSTKSENEARRMGTETDFYVSSYTVRFRRGIPNGIQLEMSACGKLPVVTKILSGFNTATSNSSIDESNEGEIETTFERSEVHVPRAGAVIVAIDGMAVEDIGFEESWRLLSALSAEGNYDSSYYAVAGSNVSKLGYSLSFKEVDASLWGNIYTLDVSASGIALSFIDDLNGRDMPLFRGKLSAVEIHAERGLGIEASILDFDMPSLLKLDSEKDDKILSLYQEDIQELQSESISTFCGIARCAVDYFHPRIACWEPLLEPSQLFLLSEKQSGSARSRRPGQLALEISDCLLRGQEFPRSIRPNNWSEPQMLSFNLTDAATEVVVKASSQWKEWRMSISDDSEDEEPLGGDQMVQRTRSFPELAIVEASSTDGGESRNGQDLLQAPLEHTASRRQEAQNVAAQKAAHAALVFAQKRGADTNKKGESAKPFLFRNRTGVSVAFVQQGRGLSPGYSRLRPNLSVVGEYIGLESYDPRAVWELADQEDAKFSMEFLSNQDSNESGEGSPKQASNKVRNYEGRFPSLTVAIQAVSGVSVDPISDLEVFKVGSTIRHLVVQKDIDTLPESRDTTQYSIPVVWKVEIEDNRRILTLSTAVRVLSIGYNAQIEVGVQKNVTLNNEGRIEEEFSVAPIGVATPESPFYLPLWLALKLESVSVFVRPAAIGAENYKWGKCSVLEFGALLGMSEGSNEMSIDPADIGKWIWKETFSETCYVQCEAVKVGSSPVWLSVFGSSPSRPQVPAGPRRRRGDKEKSRATILDGEEESKEVISVTIDSGLTLRNMLPMDVDWEVAHSMETSNRSIIDGNSVRQENDVIQGINPIQFYGDPKPQHLTSLKSGECTEIFSCDFESKNLEARFKEPLGRNWSGWVSLSLEETAGQPDDDEAEGQDDGSGSILPVARQVNVQIADDNFGVPLTLGVRIVPKISFLDEPSRGRVYGLEVIVYAELWIRNTTSLPLNFGCPSYQLKESGYAYSDGQGTADESAARFTAESALMELANLLESGDKGTGLSNKAAREVAATGEIESLPKQEGRELVEEVFEYLEIDASTVKRRWWASESYDTYRENIISTKDDGERWKWMDGDWTIDCAGDVKANLDGWESCRNLLAGAGSFNSKRDFDPAHAIRRRRFFRSRTGHNSRRVGQSSTMSPDVPNPETAGSLLGKLQAFHQPLKDSFSREQRRLRRKGKKHGSGAETDEDRDHEGLMKVAIKCGDGKWSLPAKIPDSGTSHGVVRVLSSRWPALTRARGLTEDSAGDTPGYEMKSNNYGGSASKYLYKSACLDPDLFELCYTVTDVEGEWGEFSRSMVVSPRFMVRNDSEHLHIEIKQTGAPDTTSLKLAPGEVQPFYWADFRLPGLVSVHPVAFNDMGRKVYKWSGGFDACNLGMVPLRIRHNVGELDESIRTPIRSIRAIVEIRKGTGGTGMNLSFKEENCSGDGSLFRIENMCTFPIWLAQDGVLANPLANSQKKKRNHPKDAESIGTDASEIDGDLIRPSKRSAFALDVPYRQGKYAHREAAAMNELLRVRVALAPLGSRAGVEMVKVIGLTTVGESIRLNPAKLVGTLSLETLNIMQGLRILGVVTTDGPTRVLRFCVIKNSSENVFSNPFKEVSYMSSQQQRAEHGAIGSGHIDFTEEIVEAGKLTLAQIKSTQLLSEEEAKRQALVADIETSTPNDKFESTGSSQADSDVDQIFSFRAAFSGFLCSLVDSAPSEIAVASLKNVNALARWNALRTSDASMIISIGWLQVDNHVPSAPFKVAVRPDMQLEQPSDGNSSLESENNGEGLGDSPLLVVALAFAPKHNSGIVCLRSVTVAPRDLVIALDLAFLVRLQGYFTGLKNHFRNIKDIPSLRISAVATDQKRNISFPVFEPIELDRAAAFGAESQKMYFHSLTILPCKITLSVAPARALSEPQASLEGKESAAIHQAVRKGDVLVGKSSALLGVRVGRRNATPLAVVRGVFKSIVVDALLRLDGASLNFSGVFIKNQISTVPQLSTYLLAHYLESLRHNVPALLGSLAAFGNPLGLIRGLGDGVSDFVTEPVKGLKKSVEELDPTFLVDGVARGTESLARHAVGGFAGSASLLTETFSKNMAVLTLDRRYAQKRDKRRSLRLNEDVSVTLVGGVESGFIKLVQGFKDGVTGVVKAPMRGAEKRGIEGFAKGVGKGLLGLLVKPMIGISDAATDVMIGVKSSVENTALQRQNLALNRNQIRPRRPMYARDKVLRPYKLEDAAAATLMLQTRSAGENYLSHLDMGNRVALFSVRRLILLDANGQEMLALKYDEIFNVDVQAIKQKDGSEGWGIAIFVNTRRRNGSEVELIFCSNKEQAVVLCSHIQRGIDLVAADAL